MTDQAEATRTEPTPGPWEVHEHGDTGYGIWFSIGHGGWGPIVDIEKRLYIGQDGFERPVGELKYLVISEDEQRANARLIAAAPALLEALKGLQRLAWGDVSGHSIEAYEEAKDIARAAIAKGKGDD